MTEEWIRTANMAADAATRVHRRWSHRAHTARTEEKSFSDFVTEVDREAQDAALEVVRDRHPDHLILAEEDDLGDAGRIDGAGATPLWIVDPLDGTANFLHAHPMYAASVGVAVEGEPMAGCVVHGATGERWWAGRGMGAWKNGRRIETSEVRALGGALVGTGFPFKARERVREFVEQFERVLGATSGVRRCGSAAIDLCYLAQGTLDVFWELLLNPWDVAAGLVILREAGGVASRIDGSPIGLHPGTWLAANSEEMLQSFGRVVRGE